MLHECPVILGGALLPVVAPVYIRAREPPEYRVPTRPTTLKYSRTTRVLKPLLSPRTIPTNDPRWVRDIRPRILLRDKYTCCDCSGFGDQVDHDDGNHANNDDSNLKTRCISCHSKKTARENGGFGNPKRVRT